MIRFRIATYNVHKCRGIDWRVNVSRIAKVMGEVNADIFALQELLSSQAVCLSEQMSLPHLFGAAEMRLGEDYGNAVFSRFPINGFENYSLTVKGREPRQCLRAEVLLDEKQSLHFFAVHLGTSYFERRKQAETLVSEQVLERPDLRGARIVAGDFNEWTRGLATQMLTKHLKSADVAAHLGRRTTYPGVAPFMHLDHIYYDPLFHLTAMHLHRTRTALVGSDHLPLVANFEARPEFSPRLD